MIPNRQSLKLLKMGGQSSGLTANEWLRSAESDEATRQRRVE